MPRYDFQCRLCGYTERDLFFRVAKLPGCRKCPECNRRALRQIYDEPRLALIDEDNSELYGYWHPQAGEVIRDRAHKRELMRKYGWEEGSDSVGGNRKLSEESFHEDTQPPPGDGGIQWHSRESLLKELDKKADGAVVFPGKGGKVLA